MTSVSVVLIRIKEGRSPFQADKRHFSHRLVALGLTRVQAVLTVQLTTLTTGLLGLTLYAVEYLECRYRCRRVRRLRIVVDRNPEAAPRESA